ncbi:hypothetical protein DB347_11655 [Opitutaceae bacterium EW11]|nr:hypothetical protein DB347_11655 [Opitutaceae bacterium EW11]
MTPRTPSGQPSSPAFTPRPPLEEAALGWTRGLTLVVLIGLVVEAVTGFWVWWAPFSVVAQLQLLFHTAAGALLVVPLALYQWRHWSAWRTQTLSVVKLLGFAALGATVVCLGSGVVVAVECLFGRRLSPIWDQIHSATAILLTTVLAVHLGLAWIRRASGLLRDGAFVRRLRSRGWSLAGIGAALALGLGICARQVRPLPATQPVPAGYSLPGFAQSFAEYRGSPFAPSYARTAGGTLVSSDTLAHSASCGTAGCHEQILAEWEPSAHRFSAMNPPFQAVQRTFARDRGAAETRYCAGCHDPISLFAGAKDVSNQSLSAPGMQEGASCVVCHAIGTVDQRGNADYVLVPPTRYLGETGGGFGKKVSDFLIRAYPRQHRADYNRPVLRTAEFCGSCHKQFIPEALNHFGAVPAQNQFDEWKKSHWAGESDPSKALSCRDCHMRLVADSRDPGAGQKGDPRRRPDDKTHRHHGFIATNAFMSALLKLPHHEEQTRLTQEWMEGKTVLPEIADVWPGGPVASVDLTAAPRVVAGEALEVQAVVRNRKAGHAFTTGPLDFIRAWVQLRILDASGAVLAEWGGIDPQSRDILDWPGKLHEASGSRKAGTLVLEALPLDADGRSIVRHDLWRKAGGRDTRVIFPGYADKQTYRWTVPASARGPLRVEARLNYRRYRQEFLNLVLPDMERAAGVFQPTTVMDATAVNVEVAASGSPAQP